MLDYFAIGFSGLLLCAAAQDMWKLRISNFFPVAIVGLYFARAMSIGFQTDMWQNLALFLFTLSAGIFLFAKKWLGGGDVKLFAAAALWFDFSAAPYLLFAITLGGALVALVFIFVRRLLPSRFADRIGWAALKAKGPIPYGLAISAGAILCSQVYAFNPAPQPTAKEILLESPFKQT